MPPGLGFARDYPPPPRVHWVVLLVFFSATDVLVGAFAPGPYRTLLKSIAGDAWAFYLCLWIRSLDSDARSPFWCDVYVIVEIAAAALSVRQNLSPVLHGTEAALTTAAAILGIVTVFLIRSDLVRHYNEREPYGLRLSGAMTFFFSFLYFQYHLYRIARWRQQQHAAAVPGRSLSL
jgi:hypothetical protein